MADSEVSKPIEQATSVERSRTIAYMIGELEKHARANVEVIDDPRAETLFETTADVCAGLRKAFDDYVRDVESFQFD